MIPHQPNYPSGNVTGIKLRYWDGSKGAVPGSQFTAGLYRPPGFKRESDTTVLCEGESDAWALASDPKGTWDVLALPSGAGCWKPEWASQLRQRTFIVMDDDAAGFGASQRISQSLKKRWYIIDVPKGCKDAREAYSKGWSLTSDGNWLWHAEG